MSEQNKNNEQGEDSKTTPEVQKTQREIELEKEIALVKEGASNAIKELKEDRKVLNEKIESLQPKAPEAPTPKETEDDRVAALVDKALEAKDVSMADDNKRVAMEKFITSRTDLSESSDVGGIKMTAFKRELAGFSLSGLRTEQEFLQVFGKAYTLSAGDDTPSKTSGYVPSTPLPGSQPVSVNGNDALSKDDAAMAERNGLSEEQMKERSEKHGDMLESLKFAGKMSS